MEYFFSILFGTFILEDVALAAALKLAADGTMTFPAAFLASFLGIGIGDLLLYGFGSAIRGLKLEKRFRSINKFQKRFSQQKSSEFLTYSIILCRFIPGTRFLTYSVSGFLRYPFWRFLVLTIITVFGWVTLAFIAGRSLSSLLMKHWVLGVVLVLLFLRIIKSLVLMLSNYWNRRAFLHSWRSWLSFEFWPATIFYLPIIPYYIFLSIKHGGFLMPFYANPEIENGGLIGESKWDFLMHLDKNSPHTLKSIKIKRQDDFTQAKGFLEKEGFSYPFILKPDVGQRGFGVRIIKDDFDLTEYLLLADFDMIVQSLSLYPREAGIFYTRHPSQKEGSIFSITDKVFPSVRGDGKSRLGDLILQDKRARIIAPTYFARHRESLNNIPEPGEVVPLSECGNHCQGAIFKNGKELKTAALEKEIHKIASQIPNFYFGRFDIRYKDQDSLMNGADFEIVEINGAGSEATHIWDEKTTLLEAYQTLFEQWKILFEIGAEVKKQKIARPIYLSRFLRESFRVFFRKEPLSVSS